ncbi:hypothetical protein STEG23_027638 [Scotinomys teguina]
MSVFEGGGLVGWKTRGLEELTLAGATPGGVYTVLLSHSQDGVNTSGTGLRELSGYRPVFCASLHKRKGRIREVKNGFLRDPGPRSNKVLKKTGFCGQAKARNLCHRFWMSNGDSSGFSVCLPGPDDPVCRYSTPPPSFLFDDYQAPGLVPPTDEPSEPPVGHVS